MRRALLAAGSGALLLVAAPPLDLSPLVLVALVPMLAAGRAASRAAHAAALAWITGVVFHAGLLVWLPQAIRQWLDIPWLPATALFVCYVGFHALQFAGAALCARTGGAAATRIAATVAGWVLLEWGFPKVLPWSLGATLGPHPLLRQAADVAGVHGLSALVVAVNALLAEAQANWSARPLESGIQLTCAALLMIGTASYGSMTPRQSAKSVRIAVVQAGTSAEDAPDPFTANAAPWRDYAGLSEALSADADVIVWPEKVLHVYLRDSLPWRAAAEALARRTGASLVIGALDRAADGSDLNAAYFLTPTLSAIAHKATLVPFAEYVPRLAWLSPSHASPRSAISIGAPPPIVPAAGVRLAPRICFEAILPGAYNDVVRRGADVLINLADDSWSGSAWAAAQHLEMTRLRAVETRRWLVRASHSGLSAVIDARGAIVAHLPYGERGSSARAVAVPRALSMYVRWGDAPVLALCAATLALVAARRGRRAAARRPRRPGS
jgi:apolipoprotein N-acyltransferase